MPHKSSDAVLAAALARRPAQVVVDQLERDHQHGIRLQFRRVSLRRRRQSTPRKNAGWTVQPLPSSGKALRASGILRSVYVVRVPLIAEAAYAEQGRSISVR